MGFKGYNDEEVKIISERASIERIIQQNGTAPEPLLERYQQLNERLDKVQGYSSEGQELDDDSGAW